MLETPPNQSTPSGSLTSASSDFTVLATLPYWCVQLAAVGSGPSLLSTTPDADDRAESFGPSVLASSRSRKAGRAAPEGSQILPP